MASDLLLVIKLLLLCQGEEEWTTVVFNKLGTRGSKRYCPSIDYIYMCQSSRGCGDYPSLHVILNLFMDF